MQSKVIEWKINWLQVSIGVVALLLGVVLYVYDRPASQIYFVPDLLSQYEGTTFKFGAIGYHLPAFLHVFAFSLICTGILNSRLLQAFIVCLFWLCVDGLFEIAQQQDIASVIVTYIPAWFKGIPVLENTANFFVKGRYDPADLVATLCGAISAYLVVFIVHTRMHKYEYAIKRNNKDD